jgi:hypothetical protein
MTLKLPILTKKNFNIARIACLAVSGLIVLLLSPKFPSKDFLDGLTGSIGIGSEPIRVLFLVIFALLLNSVFTYAVRGLWLRLEKEPEHTAIIKTGDLQINTSRGIAGVPYFRSRLKYIIDSPENSVVDMLNTVIGTGFSLEASDIHISPDVNTAEVVMRIHGNLYHFQTGSAPGWADQF